MLINQFDNIEPFDTYGAKARYKINPEETDHNYCLEILSPCDEAERLTL